MTDELIGTTLGQYELIELIRHGGMATVYKAYQASLDRFVAVKVMFHTRDPQFAVRFKREARAIAQLQHPNILPIYDYGEQDGLLFLALQYVENGNTLTNLISEALRPVEPVYALSLTRRLLSGLDYAHRRGIVHRDIKPGNVLMPEPDWPMLADFGIAKLLNDNTQQLTVPGLAVGTAAYMAPEQALAQAVDARTDLYAIGIVLYEMLTGRVPFDAEQPLAVLTKHVYEQPPPPRQFNRSIPAPVEEAVMRALAKSPADRYQTASEMARTLEEVGAQLRRGEDHGQVTGLYQAGVLAFAEGRWDQAVEHLGKLVALDPEYEDSADLLAAAQDASARARTEAREQIERVRQRRSSVSQSPVAGAAPATPPPASTGETTRMPAPEQATPSPASTGETTRMPAPAERSTPPPAPPRATTRMPPPAERATPPPAARALGDPATQPRETARFDALPPAEMPAAEPVEAARLVSVGAAPSPSARAAAPEAPGAAASGGERGSSRMPLIAGAVVALLLLIAGGTFAAGLWPGQRTAAVPTAESNTAPTAAGAPTAAPATAAPTTAAPTTAAPTAAAPVAELSPPAGAVVLQEDFSAAGELTGLVDRDDDSAFSRGFHPPGVYHFRLDQPNIHRLALLPHRLYAGFSLQVDVWDNSDDRDNPVGAVSQGVIFRARDAEHFYTLLVDPRGGQYSVRKYDGADSWSELIPWTPSPLVKRRGEVNTIRVDAEGDTFSLALNGQPAATFSDGDYPSGMLGFVVVNGDAVLPHMHFDNLTVWSADAPPPDPGLPPERDTPTGQMVLIPGGPFVMGDNQREDAPPHLVDVASFYLDKAEVTNQSYTACVEAGACTPQSLPSSQTHPNYATQEEYANYPALQVTWEQASQYCQWAEKRLPTEAEWEKAASWSPGQEKLVWPFGSTFDAALLNSQESGNGDTTAVDGHPAEINGTNDLAGNVSEWTSSLALPYPYDAADGREDPAAEGDRVFRGGSWAQTQGKARSALRQPSPPDYPSREIGFRCAATP